MSSFTCGMRPCSNPREALSCLMARTPWCRESGDKPLKQVLKQTGQAEQRHTAGRLYCAACKHPITGEDQRIAVRGTHEHSCTNPQEISFHIGCFRQAPGCISIGTATEEFTWFPGYAWRVALCNGCGRHLGWLFQQPGAGGFYGLILVQLAREH